MITFKVFELQNLWRIIESDFIFVEKSVTCPCRYQKKKSKYYEKKKITNFQVMDDYDRVIRYIDKGRPTVFLIQPFIRKELKIIEKRVPVNENL